MNGRPTDGIVHSARRILAILVRMAQTRLSLLAVEVVEEQRRIWLLVVLTALALLFGFMALLMASLLIVVAVLGRSPAAGDGRRAGVLRHCRRRHSDRAALQSIGQARAVRRQP